jgi:NAD-dependent SIR2 family protein deacetylase
MRILHCIECDGEYDLHSPEKRRAGGKMNHCPDCAEETTVKYAGVSAGEGKMGSVQVLKFSSQADREAYMKFWKATSGMNTGKQCQMQFRAKDPNVKFLTVATFTGNVNHKGKN